MPGAASSEDGHNNRQVYESDAYGQEYGADGGLGKKRPDCAEQDRDGGREADPRGKPLPTVRSKQKRRIGRYAGHARH